MTHPMSPSTPVTVSQVDREAASRYLMPAWGDIPAAELAHEIRHGKRDDHGLVQLIARTRLGEQAKNVAVLLMLAAFEKDGGNAEAADALDAAAESLRTTAHD